MVSLRLMFNKTLEHQMVNSQLKRFIKVQKLNLEDLKIHDEKTLSDFMDSLTENRNFCNKLEEISLRNI